MKSIKVLYMLNSGKIDELKEELRDEIYKESLKNKTGANKRYTAMKKYFTYIKTSKEILQKPSIVNFGGKNYTSFCNSFSLALTTEPCGGIELFTDTDRYPEVGRLVSRDGDERKINFTKVFASAKAQGYKLNKTELSPKFKYLAYYEGSYFKLGLIDMTYSIIDNGKEAIVYHDKNKRSTLTIENEIGICTIMPMNFKDEKEHYIVINLD